MSAKTLSPNKVTGSQVRTRTCLLGGCGSVPPCCPPACAQVPCLWSSVSLRPPEASPGSAEELCPCQPLITYICGFISCKSVGFCGSRKNLLFHIKHFFSGFSPEPLMTPHRQKAELLTRLPVSHPRRRLTLLWGSHGHRACPRSLPARRPWSAVGWGRWLKEGL